MSLNTLEEFNKNKTKIIDYIKLIEEYPSCHENESRVRLEQINYSLTTLIAFFFSEWIAKQAEFLNFRTQYEHFTEFFNLIEPYVRSSITLEYDRLEECLELYLQKDNFVLPIINNKQRCISYLIEINSLYQKALKLKLENKEVDYLRYSCKILGSTLKKINSFDREDVSNYIKKLELCEIQNDILNCGLELNLEFGSSISLAYIVGKDIDKDKLIAIFYANELDNLNNFEGNPQFKKEFPQENYELFYKIIYGINDLAEINKLIENLITHNKNHFPIAISKDTWFEWHHKLKTIIMLYEHILLKIRKPAMLDKIRLLVLGDSVSLGVGIDKPEDRWVNILAEKLEKNQLNCEIVNCSIFGRAVCDIDDHEGSEESIGNALDVFRPDILLCTLLANDFIAQHSIPQIIASLNRIIQLCIKYHIKKIVFCSGIPTLDMGASESYCKFFIEIFKTILKTHDQNLHKNIIEIQASFLPTGFLKEEYLQKDMLHPNKCAQPFFANFALESLNDLIKRTYASSKPTNLIENNMPHFPIISRAQSSTQPQTLHYSFSSPKRTVSLLSILTLEEVVNEDEEEKKENVVIKPHTRRHKSFQ